MFDFVPIPQYPDYLINQLGEVLSTKSGNLLVEHTQTSGYRYYSLFIEGKNKNCTTHRLLCHTFKGLDLFDSTLEVDHKDTDKTNNNLTNLVILTKQQHLQKTIQDKGHKSNTPCQCGQLKTARQQMCQACWQATHPTKSQEITQEDIVDQVTKGGWVYAGKMFGLSDNGLRKRYYRLSGKDPKTLKKSY